MIINDTVEVTLVHENEIGIYDTTKIIATSCQKKPDGCFSIRGIDGNWYESFPRTSARFKKVYGTGGQ